MLLAASVHAAEAWVREAERVQLERRGPVAAGHEGAGRRG